VGYYEIFTPIFCDNDFIHLLRKLIDRADKWTKGIRIYRCSRLGLDHSGNITVFKSLIYLKGMIVATDEHNVLNVLRTLKTKTY